MGHSSIAHWGLPGTWLGKLRPPCEVALTEAVNFNLVLNLLYTVYMYNTPPYPHQLETSLISAVILSGVYWNHVVGGGISNLTTVLRRFQHTLWLQSENHATEFHGSTNEQFTQPGELTSTTKKVTFSQIWKGRVSIHQMEKCREYMSKKIVCTKANLVSKMTDFKW